MRQILGHEWQKQVRTRVKVGTILRKVSPRHNVHEVVIEKGVINDPGFHRNARASARKVK